MTELIVDDRPIQPNKEYLEQKQLQYKQKKQLHDYLKKHQPFDQVLPCFRAKLKRKSHSKSPTRSQQKSKAEIYAEIKKKNIEKFGQKKHEKKPKNQKEEKKKIDPLKMTINYKPKTAVVIQTTEYKRKSPDHQNNKEASQQKNTNDNRLFQETAKQKYQKLLNIMQKERIQFAKEKQDFEKHKQKLQFKKIIQKQETVPFINQIKKNIQEKKKLQQSHRVLCKSRRQNQQSEDEKKKQTKRSKFDQNQQQIDYKKNMNQIQSRISQLEQQKQDIEDEVYKNKRNLIDPDDVVCTRYSLDRVSQIPAFDVECFKEFIDLRTLHPHGNQFYKIAVKVFETGLSVKEAKMRLQAGNVNMIKEDTQNILNTIDFKRKFQGQIRITKYTNGWIEVWNPGVQRLMANKELGYKVVWLRNGDIRQEWKDKKLESYYSKAREVVQIKFDKLPPIYYFVQLNQLQQYLPQKKLKTVMFKEGRVESFSTQQDLMNGFAV